MKVYRTHNCAELSLDHVDQEVTLSGWVHRVRDHGGVLFIDLRDHYGITQVVIDPDSKDFVNAETYRSEWCIKVAGRVKARESDLINKNLQTGYIEVFIDNTEIISTAEDLPLPVFGELEYPEETRLRYRFLDLRREGLHKNMLLRADVIASIIRDLRRDVAEVITHATTRFKSAAE